MAKKSRSKGKKKTHRPQLKSSHGSSGLDHRRNNTDNVSPFAGGETLATSDGLYFLNQYPVYNVQAPLTNRNLQTLLEQNAHDSRTRPIALDMERFAHEQQEHGHAQHDQDNYSDYSKGTNNLLEFGESNPSLDHLSDLTSLDDVCFPDYYDHRLDDDNLDRPYVWPDLLVLEEYIAEEIEDLHSEMKEDAENFQAVNFRIPVARHVQPSNAADPDPLNSEVLPGSEDAPLLHLIRVDEGELLRLSTLSLRVRPKQTYPWQKSEEQVKILNNPNQRKSERLCRFTYFREDIEGTIHSPTLSGLVDSDLKGLNREEILLSLLNLFGQFHHTKTEIASRNSSADIASLAKKTAHPHNGNSTSSGAASVPQNSFLHPSSAKLSSPHPASSTASPLAASSSSSANKKSPFWLDILDPLEEEMKVISKTFGLHPLTTEDIFLGEAREKVELFKLYYLICFTSFDVVYERRKQRAMEHEKKFNKLQEYSTDDLQDGHFRFFTRLFGKQNVDALKVSSRKSKSTTTISKGKKARSGELSPLNMYMIIFKHGVLTFHFSATPHPINVRRRIRMLKDHLNVSTDWICYGLIDDITDSFAPLIDSIEQEVYLIEDQIMKLNSGDETDTESDDSETDDELILDHKPRNVNNVFYRRQRSKSVVEANTDSKLTWRHRHRGSKAEYAASDSKQSVKLKSSRTLTTRSTLSGIVAWKRKGDMLRRIGECRKRVMSVMRLLGSKADVIKGFSKRFSENESLVTLPVESRSFPVRQSLRHEILMYLGDIQDHIVTMVQSLNHYEKLLARSHSNYLALLNIDMTKINNDTNDILGKVTILGTILLPINVVTGLWGMNCIVPGQDHPGLMWFYGILLGITLFSICSYIYARRVTGL